MMKRRRGSDQGREGPVASMVDLMLGGVGVATVFILAFVLVRFAGMAEHPTPTLVLTVELDDPSVGEGLGFLVHARQGRWANVETAATDRVRITPGNDRPHVGSPAWSWAARSWTFELHGEFAPGEVVGVLLATPRGDGWTELDDPAPVNVIVRRMEDIDGDGVALELELKPEHNWLATLSLQHVRDYFEGVGTSINSDDTEARSLLERSADPADEPVQEEPVRLERAAIDRWLGEDGMRRRDRTFGDGWTVGQHRWNTRTWWSETADNAPGNELLAVLLFQAEAETAPEATEAGGFEHVAPAAVFGLDRGDAAGEITDEQRRAARQAIAESVRRPQQRVVMLPSQDLDADDGWRPVPGPRYYWRVVLHPDDDRPIGMLRAQSPRSLYSSGAIWLRAGAAAWLRPLAVDLATDVQGPDAAVHRTRRLAQELLRAAADAEQVDQEGMIAVGPRGWVTHLGEGSAGLHLDEAENDLTLRATGEVPRWLLPSDHAVALWSKEAAALRPVADELDDGAVTLVDVAVVSVMSDQTWAALGLRQHPALVLAAARHRHDVGVKGDESTD